MAQLPTKLTPFPLTKDVLGTRPKADFVEHEVFHEIGQELVGTSTVTKDVAIKPSRVTTVIRLKSTVIAPAAARLSSPQYIAATRRRKVSNLLAEMQSLEAHADRDDFAVFTRSVVARIRELLDYLQSAKLEGNTRQILRNVRDSFLNGGWDRYKVAASREGVMRILRELAVEEEVTRDMAEQAFDALFDLGLDPVASIGFYYHAADTEGQEVDAED